MIRTQLALGVPKAQLFLLLVVLDFIHTSGRNRKRDHLVFFSDGDFPRFQAIVRAPAIQVLLLEFEAI